MDQVVKEGGGEKASQRAPIALSDANGQHTCSLYLDKRHGITFGPVEAGGNVCFAV
ncbi:MAG: hypothetical protein Q9163_005203 [Psora crenata]